MNTSISTDWKKQLGGAFAWDTAPFGAHPNDHKRAEHMFRLAFHAGASFEDIIREARKYLKNRGVTSAYIDEQVLRIERFKNTPFKILEITSAWLVTWEGSEAPAKIEDKVLSILNYRRSSGYVRKYLEQAYVDHGYSLHEKLVYARHSKNNPYSAQFEYVDRIKWTGKITCGHNPFLLARKVRNVSLSKAGSHDIIAWDEITAKT